MSGTLTQLAAKGAQDRNLTVQPEITFFKGVWKHHTNFAVEAIEQEFTTGEAKAGTTATAEIPRSGDLVTDIWIKMTLNPILNANQVPFSYPMDMYSVTYVDEVGHALIKKVKIEIGGHQFDAHSSEFLHAYHELSKKAGRDTDRLIGKFDNIKDRIAASSQRQHLYVPLRFWFNETTSQALPLVALMYHQVKVVIEFRTMAEVITATPFNRTAGASAVGGAETEFWNDGATHYKGPTGTMTSGTRVDGLGETVSIYEAVYDAARWPDDYDSNGAVVGSVTSTIETDLSTTEDRLAASGNYITTKVPISPPPIGVLGVPNNTKVAEKSVIFTENGSVGQAYFSLPGGKTEIMESCKLLINYVFLDSVERKLFATMEHNYLIDTVQQDKPGYSTGDQNSMSLMLNHPVKELIWCVRCNDTSSDTPDIVTVGGTGGNSTQRWGMHWAIDHTHDFWPKDDDGLDASTLWTTPAKAYHPSYDNTLVKNYFNFTGPNPINTELHGFDSATLKLNGHTRFEDIKAPFLHTVIPAKYHSSTPKSMIYNYSFALDPEDWKPTGSINMSRIDTVKLELKHGSIKSKGWRPEAEMFVFARSINIMKVTSGMAGLKYSN